MTDKNINYEVLPAGMAMDETDVNLRSYFSRMSDEKLTEYDQRWTDDQVIAWDDNFEIEEYRRVLAEHIRFRFHGVPK
jgi:hypothetical protein